MIGEMNKRTIIFLTLLYIGSMLIATGVGYWLNSPVEAESYSPPANLGYLILQMERARDTHQQFVDGNNAYSFQVEVHREWVEIYGQVIAELEARK